MTESPPAGERKFGEESKPRALFSWDGPDHGRVAEVLALHAPTIKLIERLDEVQQSDYDLFVTNRMGDFISENAKGRAATEPANHVCVITFGGPVRGQGEWGPCDAFRSPRFLAVEWRAPHLAKAVVIPDDLLPAASDLVRDDLVPIALQRKSHTTFHTRGWAYGNLELPDLDSIPPQPLPGQVVSQPPRPAPDSGLNPFLWAEGDERRILAGWYRRSGNSEGWALPADVKRPWDWVAAAIRHWAITYGRFPLVGGWWEDRTWQTQAEAEAVGKRTTLKEDLAAVSARLEAEIATASGALEAAARDAAMGPRRLLTEKGDPLKEAVAVALGQLGFVVTDRDLEEPPDPGGKIEDLGVVDPDDPTVDPIVEVKGYDSGARANDLASMGRHLVRAFKAGRSPTAIWWIANHWRKRSPDDRPPLLDSEEPLIAKHAADDEPLVLIDTRDLFKAVRAVEDGRIHAADLRASLRAARGRWGGT